MEKLNPINNPRVMEEGTMKGNLILGFKNSYFFPNENSFYLYYTCSVRVNQLIRRMIVIKRRESKKVFRNVDPIILL